MCPSNIGSTVEMLQDIANLNAGDVPFHGPVPGEREGILRLPPLPSSPALHLSNGCRDVRFGGREVAEQPSFFACVAGNFSILKAGRRHREAADRLGGSA